MFERRREWLVAWIFYQETLDQLGTLDRRLLVDAGFDPREVESRAMTASRAMAAARSTSAPPPVPPPHQARPSSSKSTSSTVVTSDPAEIALASSCLYPGQTPPLQSGTTLYDMLGRRFTKPQRL